MNNDKELVDVWKDVKYLTNFRGEAKFLQALKPAKSVTFKHVPGELAIETKTYGYKIQVKGYHTQTQEIDINPALYGNAAIPNSINPNSPIIVSLGTALNPASKGRFRISDVRNYVKTCHIRQKLM